MQEGILAVLGGGMGAALVTGLWTMVQYKLRRRDEHSDRVDAQKKALRYIMLYIIEERAKEHIRNGAISMEARRSLHHWHELYHNGLGGNGDADTLMGQVDRLPLKMEEE